jgi:hypothetical protein
MDNAKKILGCLVFILSFWLNMPGAAGDKFGSSVSTDYLTQETPQDFKKTNQATSSSPPLTQTLPLPANNLPVPVNNNPGLNAQTTNPPVIQGPITSTNLPTIGPGAPLLSSSPTIPHPTKSIADIKKVNITVPDFEAKYKELFEMEQAKKNKKKKSLIDSILDEIVHYGILIILGLVVLVVIYTIKKDKDITPQEPLPEAPKNMEQKKEGKKDIWEEDF